MQSTLSRIGHKFLGGIHGRLLVLTAGSVVTVSFFLVLVFLLIFRIEMQAHYDNTCEASLRKLEKVLSVPFLKQDFTMIVDIVDAEVKSSDLDFCWVLDRDGLVLVCNDPTQSRRPIDPKYSSREDFRELASPDGFHVCILPNRQVISTIEKKTFSAMVVASGILLGGFVLLAWGFSIRVAHPIEEAARAAASIADGHYEPVFPKTGVKEIQGLFSSLSEMARRIGTLTESLEEERDRFRMSEQKFRRLVENLPDTYFFFSLKPHGELSYLSPSFTSILGYPLDGTVSSFESLFTGDETGKRASRAMALSLKGVKQRSFEVEVRHREGDTRLLEVLLVPLFDRDGHTMGAEGIARDATAQRRAEQQLIRAQKMEIVGNLAGGIAHDFNNILGGIVGTLSVIRYHINRGEKFEGAELEMALATMEHASQSAMDLVNQLLSLSRKKEYRFAVVDLKQTIQHILKMCRSSFDRSVEIRERFGPGSAMAVADPVQVEQVVLNLLVNAEHAMTRMRPPDQPWGGVLEVSMRPVVPDRSFLSAHPEAGEMSYWCVSIADTGVGMTPDVIARIFDPFFTTKEKGTGLGLAMVYNIIRQHHGFLDVYSEPGGGSTFNVYFPQADTGVVEPSSRGGDVLPRGTGLILVVDDDLVMRTLARGILEECGYRIMLAEDGVECLRLYEKHQGEIRLVLLDMVMPRMSGRNAFLEMQKINPDVCVLLSSGFKMDERVQEMLSLGIRGFIQKPYTMLELGKKVAEILSS